MTDQIAQDDPAPTTPGTLQAAPTTPAGDAPVPALPDPAPPAPATVPASVAPATSTEPAEATGALDAATGEPGGAGTLSLLAQCFEFVDRGGIAMWGIAFLSVLTLAIILLKLWRLARSGAWRGANAEEAVTRWGRGDTTGAMRLAGSARGLRGRVVAAAMAAVQTHGGATAEAREETTRVARQLLAETASSLRALELIATIAPLLGLLGTVLGMITAFQALQAAGTRADPSALAGGIWEALLTTAAGMAVAIPASVALTWFESIVERTRLDMEDLATRIFTRHEARHLVRAAE